MKGIGETHAKWSPVCPTSYRMRPHVTVRPGLVGAEAEELRRACPMGVFDIEDSGELCASRPLKCTYVRIIPGEGQGRGRADQSRRRPLIVR